MKRILFGLPIFPLTFAIGYFFIPDFQNSTAKLVPIGIPTIVVSEPVIAPIGDSTSNSDRYFESFIDESRIGRKRKNKVEITCFERGSDFVAGIRFYSRSKNGDWEQRQSFEFKQDDLTGCDPEIKDFNNDGLKDLTYKSNVAARRANEVRTLFIYDKKKDELIHIKNSEDYPNMLYNKKLDCIDAWLFHAATTTVFLRIEGDMLREFASVDTGLEQVVAVTDKNGARRVLSRKKMREDDIYTRYSSFDPPRP